MPTSERRKQALRRRTRREARAHGVRPQLLEAQLGQESGYNEDARSPAGAAGVAQFIPSTAAQYGVDLNDGRSGDDIRGAARFMADLLKRFNGDERLALAAYNAGPGAVQRYGGVPPYAETQNYVESILGQAKSGGSYAAPGGPAAAPSLPGVDRQALLRSYLDQRGRPDALLALAQGLQQAEASQSPAAPSPARYGAPPGKGSTNIGEILQLATQYGLKVAEHPDYGGVDPVHTDGSYHYQGAAGDITGPPEALAQFARILRKRYGKDLEELIWRGRKPQTIKNGRRVPYNFYDKHRDHIHVADQD